MKEFAIIYAVSVTFCVAIGLVGWTYHLSHPRNLRMAREYLTFIPKSLIWPHYAGKAIVRTVRMTLREED